MIKSFLKAKHWQIFLIVFVIPYALHFIAMTITKNDHEKMMYFSPFIIIIFLFGLFGWFWSIATGLQTKIPERVKMKVSKFKIFLLIPMIYIPFAFGLIDMLFDNGSQTNGTQNGAMIGVAFAIIFLLHILSMFGLLYSYYFVAKTFKTVELQREVAFSDFAGDFFMFLFFPIGIWVIQPKINLMID